jgi:hypothetical protein
LKHNPDSSDEELETVDANEGWPEHAHYMPVAPGARNISLKAQPNHMKLVLKSAITSITGATLFKTAFPPLDSEESREHYRKILIKCANNIENEELRERFKQDDNIVVASARVVRIFSILLYSNSELLIYYKAKCTGFKHPNSS